MRIFLPKITWEGDFGKYFVESMKENGIDVFSNTNKYYRNPFLKYSGLRLIEKIKLYEREYYTNEYAKELLNQCINASPDVFFVFNQSKLNPNIIKSIKEKCKCLMVLALGDDPWDSARWFDGFPHSLKYFDIIFSADPSWNNNIRKVAPNAKIFWHFGGYDEKRFKPVYPEELSKIELEIFSSDIAFTGSSYAKKAEGAYRADVLSFLSDYNLKIWGGDNWEYRFKFNPVLKKHFHGARLSYDKLRKLYATTSIFLNLPAPQITWGFQPRVFEIAGCKGFQIADNRLLLRYLFSDDELVVFDSIPDLKEKVEYYLKHDKERNRLAENLYKRVINQYTWRQWSFRIINTIKTGIGIENLDLRLMNTDKKELSEYLKNA